jgi:hypothetical protein
MPSVSLLALSVALAAPDPHALAAHAPTVPDLRAAEARLEALLRMSRATGVATARLQVAWTERGPVAGTSHTDPTPAASCDAEVLAIGWRVERFGAAWREAAQAARVQAARVRDMQLAPTVAPLVDARWSARIGARVSGAEAQERAFLEAGAWQAAWVRPELDRCPAPPAMPAQGIATLEVRVREAPLPDVAVIGLGDGWICAPGLRPTRAEDSLVLIPTTPEGAPRACWSAEAGCGCTMAPVLPGALLGAPVEPPESPVAP